MARKRTDSKDRPIAVEKCQGFDMRPDDGNSPRCTKDGEAEWCEKTAKSWGQPFTTHAWMCERHRDYFGYVLSFDPAPADEPGVV